MNISTNLNHRLLAAKQVQGALINENAQLDRIEEQLDQIEEREQMQRIRSKLNK